MPVPWTSMSTWWHKDGVCIMARRKKHLTLENPNQITSVKLACSFVWREIPVSVLGDCKQICTLLQRETLPQSFKSLYSPNILVTKMCNNEHSGHCLQDLQKCKTQMVNCITTGNMQEKEETRMTSSSMAGAARWKDYSRNRRRFGFMYISNLKR